MTFLFKSTKIWLNDHIFEIIHRSLAGEYYMTTLKRLVLSSTLGLGMAIVSLQSAFADPASVYTKFVLPKAQIAAKEALDSDMRGSEATCYIAKTARQAAIDNGLTSDSPGYQDVVARATYQSAKDKRILDLLTNEVVLDCEAGAIIPAGLYVGGTVLAIAGIAAVVDNNNGSSTAGRAPLSP